MIRFRHSAPLGVLFALGACVAAPPPGYVAAPGKGKDAAAFQRDDEACHKQADGSPDQSAGTASASSKPDGGTIYMQCMTARGNTVTQASAAAYPSYDYPYAYGYPYPYAYPYAYPFLGYPAFVGGPFVGFGFGFCCGGYHGGYFHGGYARR